MVQTPESVKSAPERPISSDLLRRQLQMLPADEIVALIRTLEPHILKAALRPKIPSADKRNNQRNRTLHSGKIIYNNQASVIDCQIRDMSKSGCRVRVTNPAAIPDGFVLQVVGRGQQHSCAVSWRTAEELGVKFLD